MPKKERIILKKQKTKGKKLNSMRTLLIVAGLVIIFGLVVSFIANSSANKFKEPAQKVVPNPSASTQASPGTNATTDSEVNTEDWETYSEGKAEFSFLYPADIELGSPDPESNKVTLSVASRPIDDLKSETSLFGYDKKTARDDRDALNDGEPGEDFPEMHENSFMVKEIAGGDKAAKSFMVLSKDALCDVTFERNLIFYNNKNQIIITLTGPKINFMDKVRQLFENDPVNCEPTDKVWLTTGQDQFYNFVEQGIAPIEIQKWYNTFDDIANTIELEAVVEEAETIKEKEDEQLDDKKNSKKQEPDEIQKINFKAISN
ncbi:hypothetical protein KKC88_01180 [Patescibacteria group bacterium]|nr:hypothetical protein [Patescibacteria group bacterium]MBU1672844.1 hypothetical protein [Patescibacteria group bacterium]MBU1963735.1 hypothetical protein [Patescibacteria group bacterium]